MTIYVHFNLAKQDGFNLFTENVGETLEALLINPFESCSHAQFGDTSTTVLEKNKEHLVNERIALSRK